jgi:hypothetical protein
MADVAAAPATAEVRFMPLPNYLWTRELINRDWGTRNAESFDVHRRILRLSPPVLSTSHEYCHKCEKRLASHTMLGARLCDHCLNEFIVSKSSTVEMP